VTVIFDFEVSQNKQQQQHQPAVDQLPDIMFKKTKFNANSLKQHNNQQRF
jgi:hypothetical protein